ncbi:C-terminal processing peptidase-2 [[Leptolyngbya] sp. PCC 7376]|uniref:carboxyl-terminal processing protease CtpB n=1 Tax=[Leptolyngbya] sp. PCC 7376 TaxID=111781 RepID=UPI00029ECB57|nr:carboxyl-terminal processing protease CtpB [[Leptolyngbya] sp. PCC 7376]AFY38357.1 C-terminal processing peptidase-2 [[Leptolyngbya] sp. PCC 7376]
MTQTAPFLAISPKAIFNGALGTISLLTLLTTTPIMRPAIAAMEDSPKVVVDEIWQIIHAESVAKNYDAEEWLKLRSELLEQQYDSYDTAYSTIRDALDTLGDPYTRFLDPEQFEDLTSQTTGELSGIGIRLAIDEETGLLTVVDVLDSSPAEAGGLKVDDQIVQIDGQITALLTLEQSSNLIRGQEGSAVLLKVSRPERPEFDLELVRATIELPAVTHRMKQVDGESVGYIRLDEFSSHAAEQMYKAIQDLESQAVEGFVLDLRGNPGGLLYSSVDIARMWMEEGAIVRTVDRKGGDREFSANQTAITDLPLVVLVNENSASASEILAAALKDNNRATLVGTRTYGKGTVQSVHELSNGAGLAVTISRYYPPSGISINMNGVNPDITVELSREQFVELNSDPGLIATNADPQYSKAINILRNQRLSEQSLEENPLNARTP